MQTDEKGAPGMLLNGLSSVSSRSIAPPQVLWGVYGRHGSIGTHQHRIEEHEERVIGVPSLSIKASLSASMWKPPRGFTDVAFDNGVVLSWWERLHTDLVLVVDVQQPRDDGRGTTRCDLSKIKGDWMLAAPRQLGYKRRTVK